MRAYCLDLRERIMAFLDEGNFYDDAVETFKVSYSFIRALERQRATTGELTPKPHGGGNPGCFKQADLMLLRRLSEEHPDAYLQELADLLVAAGGPRVQPPTLCKRLKQLGLTRKKKPCGPPSKTQRKYKRSERPFARRSAP